MQRAPSCFFKLLFVPLRLLRLLENLRVVFRITVFVCENVSLKDENEIDVDI